MRSLKSLGWEEISKMRKKFNPLISGQNREMKDVLGEVD